MKRLILVLLLVPMLCSAGPVTDRVQAILNGLQGETVLPGKAMYVLDAYAEAFEQDRPMGIVTTQVCEMEGQPEVEVCRDVDTVVRRAASDLSDEEKAQIYVNRHTAYTLRVVNERKRRLKRESLQIEQDALDAQVIAAEVADL